MGSLRIFRLEEAQAQSIGDDEYRAEAHRQGSDHWVHFEADGGIEAAGGNWNPDDVVDEGPEKILFDVADGGLAEFDGPGNVEQVVFHEHDVGRFHGHIGAGANGDADIGAGKGRCVVDAVANHGDFLAFVLQTADFALLILWQYFRDDAVGADLLANGFGGFGMVAGEHDDINAHALQFFNGSLAGWLDDIGDSDDAAENTILSKEERCFALFGEGVLQAVHVRGDNVVGLHEFAVAGQAVFAANAASNALARDLLEIFYRLRHKLTCVGFGGDGAGQWMFGELFKGGSQAQQAVFADAVLWNEIGYNRLALGDGTGFIHDDDIDGMGRFQRFSRFDENAVRSAAASTDHDGCWCGQPEGARAGDDKHGNSDGQCKFKAGADKQPDDGGNHRDGDDNRHENPGDLVGQFGDRCFRTGGFVDKLNDLGQRGFVANLIGTHGEVAALVDGGADDLIAAGLVHRNGLTGDGRFVDRTMAFKEHAVDRDRFPGFDDENVAFFDLFSRNDGFLAVTQHGGLFWRQVQQLVDGV